MVMLTDTGFNGEGGQERGHGGALRKVCDMKGFKEAEGGKQPEKVPDGRGEMGRCFHLKSCALGEVVE